MSAWKDHPEMYYQDDDDQSVWDRLREEEESRDWLQGDQPRFGEEELT